MHFNQTACYICGTEWDHPLNQNAQNTRSKSVTCHWCGCRKTTFNDGTTNIEHNYTNPNEHGFISSFIGIILLFSSVIALTVYPAAAIFTVAPGLILLFVGTNKRQAAKEKRNHDEIVYPHTNYERWKQDVKQTAFFMTHRALTNTELEIYKQHAKENS